MAVCKSSPFKSGENNLQNAPAKTKPKTTATRPNTIKILKIFDVNSSATSSPSSFFALV